MIIKTRPRKCTHFLVRSNYTSIRKEPSKCGSFSSKTQLTLLNLIYISNKEKNCLLTRLQIGYNLTKKKALIENIQNIPRPTKPLVHVGFWRCGVEGVRKPKAKTNKTAQVNNGKEIY